MRTPNEQPLERARDAVRKLDGFLTERFGPGKPGDRVSLVDTGATKDAVKGVLAQTASLLADDDLYVLLFSGHGIAGSLSHPFQAWRLYNQDATIEDQLTDHELAAALASIPAGVEIVIVSDSCFGEGMLTEGLAKLKLGTEHLDTARTAHIALQLDSLSRSRAKALATIAGPDGAGRPIVGVSAAWRNELAVGGETSLLVDRLIAGSTPAGGTYQTMKNLVEQDRAAGTRQYVYARPEGLLQNEAFRTTS